MLYSEISESTRLNLLTLAAACLVSVVFIIIKTCWSQKNNFPPGPISFPIIGYFPMLSSQRHLKLTQVAKKYGDIFSIRFGTSIHVVLNSGDAVREVLSKPELGNRPDQELFLITPIKDPVFCNGLARQEHKKFLLQVFKKLNDEKAMEELMKVEIKRFVDKLRDHGGEPHDARESLFRISVDIVTRICFGKNVHVEDCERKKFQTFVSELMKLIEKSTVFILYPWMKKIGLIRKILRQDEFMVIYNEADTFLKNMMEELKLRSDRNADCIAQHYLENMSSNKRNDKNSTFSEEFLVDLIKGLYGAQSETTRNSVIWALYTVAVHQDVQRRIHMEIDEVVGHDRAPSFSDQKNMRYTQAVLMEMNRWQTIVPLGIRTVSSDTTFGPYHVPKDTLVLVNHWAIHHDSRCWKNADEFIPERFLSADGEHILKHKNYMPFSYGKRSCLGEGIAITQTFLTFVSILQRFRVELPEGDKPNFEGVLGLTLEMKRHRLCYIPREA